MAGAARIFACRCGVTVLEVDEVRYVWTTGEVHTCGNNQLAWIDALATDALNGDHDSARLLAEAVDTWVRQ